MNRNLYLLSDEIITLEHGWPTQSGVVLLPLGKSYYAQKDFGIIHLQEVKTSHYLIRYFVFNLLQQMTLLVREKGEGLQSLISLKGQVNFGFRGGLHHHINEGQFTILQAGNSETQTIIPAGKECHLFNVYYPTDKYPDLFQLFPSIKRDIKKAKQKPRFFLPHPRPVRHTVLDAIRSIFFEIYQPQLQTYFWGLQLRQALFTQLAQTYTEQSGRISSPLEKEMAEKARDLIIKDISKHFSNEELAQAVNWSESSLKRAFRQEFGTGMYEYLRNIRMQKARELLLQGEQVKTVAPAIGMRPSNFTSEFQKYFGYKATSLKRVKK